MSGALELNRLEATGENLSTASGYGAPTRVGVQTLGD